MRNEFASINFTLGGNSFNDNEEADDDKDEEEEEEEEEIAFGAWCIQWAYGNVIRLKMVKLYLVLHTQLLVLFEEILRKVSNRKL